MFFVETPTNQCGLRWSKAPSGRVKIIAVIPLAPAHRRSLGFARDDKGEGGDCYWEPPDRMDRKKQQTAGQIRLKLDDLARKINRGAPLTMTILWEFNEKHPKQVARGCSPWVFKATAQALYAATPLLMPTSAACK